MTMSQSVRPVRLTILFVLAIGCFVAILAVGVVSM